MRYELDFEYVISQEMNKGGKFTHFPNKRMLILPYGVNYNEDVQDIKSLVGEISRRCINKTLTTSINKQDILNNIKEKVDSESNEVLLNFVEQLYFDDKGELELFHPKVFAYSQLTKKGKLDQERIGKFLYDTLFSGLDKTAMNAVYDQNGDLMVQLIISSLPKLVSVGDEELDFINYVPIVKEVFQEDMNFIMKNNKYFIKCFEGLIKYYYFYYTSQIALKLNQRQEANLNQISPLYFRLASEEGGKNRPCYLQGYRLLKSGIENLFSNVMLVQFLNYNKHSNNVYTLPEWYQHYVKEATDQEKVEVINSINSFIALYKEQFDISWDNMNTDIKEGEEKVAAKINELVQTISYQFKSGTRKRAAEGYKKWFTEYCNTHYLERRGSLGYMLTIDDKEILFITGICIKDNQKMRLSELFMEFERRGLYFDDISKEKIASIYERSNLLEKKSDSGDAQYVRAIL